MNRSNETSATRLLLTNLRTTPLLDMLRGRLTGSLDLRRVIAAAALPRPLADLIRRVARRTRLWRIERVDVARELAEHFRDGLAAGRTAEQLAESFGNPRQAARLIRRAKLRSRPLFWRVWRRGAQALGGIAAMLGGYYLWLGIQLIAHHPTITHDYRHEIVGPTQNVPAADRGWPFYRQAILELMPEPADSDVTLEKHVDQENWSAVETWLAENRTALDKVRQGATRPRLGFAYSDPADNAWLNDAKVAPQSTNPRRNALAFGIVLPQLNALRPLVNLLEADTVHAVAAGDRQALLADFTALISLADQVRGDVPLLVVDNFAMNTFEWALNWIDRTLARHPAILTDDDLAELSHRVAGFAGGGTITPRIEGERLAYHDFLQHLYSDDGQGDGVLTREGLELLDDFSHVLTQTTTPQRLTIALFVPVAGGVMPRKEATDLGEALYRRAEANFHRPLWEHPTFETGLPDWLQDPAGVIRRVPLMVFYPYFQLNYVWSQRRTQERDGTLVALALTLYRRQHGAWPQALDELVPDLLPAVPPDRFTGQPLKYRVVEGRPVVYSVGPDREDNGGRPQTVTLLELDQFLLNAIQPAAKPATSVRGWDWILWQPSAEPAAASS